ncbi:acryloyl-CoA reductase [Halobacillus sp. Marseille-P3879]|uniref:acrylyl-CoA reductase family protein n=1 Tax=Halobacillus sp. Marseille-P3879 TaxID=2045014 RepID=UPI000C7E68A0|nr:acryloyl-CoA reductase [Halobacillus sp. Marseille-P3879]
MSDFQAYTIDKNENGEIESKITSLSRNNLPDSDVLIKVHYSSVNYKDGMVATPNNPLVKNYPIVPGIDLSGKVVESRDSRFKPGDAVIATSYEIGVNHHGGYSEYATIPGEWVVPLPDGISLEEAMIYGTAGFTAALSVHRLENTGLKPDHGKILVPGASGGVGSMAVAMLSKRGYHVEASTGSTEHSAFLKELGAENILTREDVYDGRLKPIQSERWAAAVDPVGGEQLASILSQLKYNGAAAVSGLTGGTKIPTEVYPFILRGISLIGIDSVYCPMPTRKKIWHRLANDLKTTNLFDEIKSEISLKELPETLNQILQGQTRGRVIVKV